MTPLERYERALARPGFTRDPVQRLAVEHLDRLYRAVMTPPARDRRWWSFASARDNPTQPKGLYLWGAVGRGKTLLVDLFHSCLPPEICRRQHFHGFMRGVHAELRRLNQVQDPLRTIAKSWARDLRVLCLDEFHVTDITDAMLLARLLEALFARDVVLVLTSNEAPDELYRDGLQRERFLPAIALLKEHLTIFELSGAVDYRLRALEQVAVYRTPDDAQARAALSAQFEALTLQAPTAGTLDLDGRPLRILGAADGVLWSEFDALCESPRGTHDYIELGRCFHTLLLSGIPVMDDDRNDAARRFINLIDEMYDRNVNLLVTAQVEPRKLYCGQRLASVFPRTASRLIEMQSREYLTRPHRSE